MSNPAKVRELSSAAGELVELAHTYWQDGALLTASVKLRAAADKLKDAFELREQLIDSMFAEKKS